MRGGIPPPPAAAISRGRPWRRGQGRPGGARPGVGTARRDRGQSRAHPEQQETGLRTRQVLLSVPPPPPCSLLHLKWHLTQGLGLCMINSSGQ